MVDVMPKHHKGSIRKGAIHRPLDVTLKLPTLIVSVKFSSQTAFICRHEV